MSHANSKLDRIYISQRNVLSRFRNGATARVASAAGLQRGETRLVDDLHAEFARLLELTAGFGAGEAWSSNADF